MPTPAPAPPVAPLPWDLALRSAAVTVRRRLGALVFPRRGEPAGGEERLLAALRRGDESAYAALIDSHHAAMTRVAMLYVRDRTVAEEVVQEAWIGVLQGLYRFEGRSSLKTWIFRILTNVAKTRAVREGRSVPFSALTPADVEPGEPVVDQDRFLDADARYPGHWREPPRSFAGIPDERLVSRETLSVIAAAIEALPPAQREVIRLRDVEGWSSAEVCEALDLTEGNQRVLLHRARSKVRRALERYLEES